MNTSAIKTYAPKARNDFIQAVTERANLFGIYGDDHIEPMEVKGDVTIIGERVFTHKAGKLRNRLIARIQRDGFERVMESAAYTWFNRFVAIRYMEINGYLDHGCRVFSNPGGSDIPEILTRAAEIDLPGLDRNKVIELRLAGDKDNELFRMLLIAQCNDLHESMPFLFDAVDSETELLLPDNLLHTNSVIRKMVSTIEEELWKEVEIIGWIYQFYISEKKDQVIGKVVKSEDIPAATQLFTPKWIVRYMVQNTLGRMWMAAYPDSALKDKMEYYIEPAEQEPDVQAEIDRITPKELNPETITFLDPACGSGHILTEAYNLFKEIYLERGYRTRDIARVVLKKNLFGLEIDDRAAQLAGFAVLMKARKDDRRILTRDEVKLNVMAIQEGNQRDLRNILLFFKGEDQQETRNILKELVKVFENGKTFGSLITIPEHIAEKIGDIKTEVNEKLGSWFQESDAQNIRVLVDQASILAKKYDCVVTNPPYMGSKGMNTLVKDYLKNNFTDVKSDLFAAFILRNTKLAAPKGQLGYMSPFVWMFISSYEKLRKFLINKKTITSLIQLEYSGFDGATVPICTFTIANSSLQNFKGGYVQLTKFRGAANQGPKTLEAIKNPNCGWFYRASSIDFKKIPGNPIAYWVSEAVRKAYSGLKVLDKYEVKEGLGTRDDARFLRQFWEVNFNHITFDKNKIQKWVPVDKAGGYRKWYGSISEIMNWENDGKDIKTFQKSCIRNTRYFFRFSVGWGKVGSGTTSFRLRNDSFAFVDAAPSAFGKNLLFLLASLNSCVIKYILAIQGGTLNVTVGVAKSLPLADISGELVSKDCIEKSKIDWNSYETSWDFDTLPLLHSHHHQTTLKATYGKVRAHWQSMTLEMQCLEEENNRIFIEAYGLQDELTPDVPLSEITLTCNPHYRYNGNKSEEELEALLRADTIKELVSYAIGCMMGRYSLDNPGLVYAHSGNIGFDPSEYQTFPADNDGIIPVMDEEWFSDDATNRLVKFIKTAWTPEYLDENLQFIAGSLGPRTNEMPVDTIRRYISTGFFKDHLRTYKKRPIYWLFSSGKLKAFECLVYLHRYNESTLSRMRSSYVTPLQGNFSARLQYLQNELDAAAATTAKRKIQKEIDLLKKKMAELKTFDDHLRHHADMRISLDLDDGVKVNYGKFGNLLAETKAITGN